MSHMHRLVDPFSTFVHFHERISTTVYKKKKKRTNCKYVINISIYLYRFLPLLEAEFISKFTRSLHFNIPLVLVSSCTTIRNTRHEKKRKKRKKKKTRKRGLLYHTRITLIRFERAWNLNSPVRFRGISSCATSLSLFFHGPNCSPFVSFLERRSVFKQHGFSRVRNGSYKSIGMETRWNVD